MRQKMNNGQSVPISVKMNGTFSFDDQVKRFVLSKSRFSTKDQSVMIIMILPECISFLFLSGFAFEQHNFARFRVLEATVLQNQP